MSDIKEAAIELIRRLPEDVSWDSLAYSLAVRAKVEGSLREMETSPGTSHDDVVKEFERWRVEYHSKHQDLKAQIELGLDDVRNGRVMDHDEFMMEVDRWVESYGPTNHVATSNNASPELQPIH